MKKLLSIIFVIILLFTLYFYEKNIDFFSFDKQEEVQILLENINNNSELILETKEIEKKLDISEIIIDGEIVVPENISNVKITEETSIIISGEPKKSDISSIDKEEDKIEANNDNIDNISIEKLNYSSNVSNIIKITGNNLDQIEYVIIGDMSFKPEYNTDYLYVLVEKNNILNGEQIVFFQRLNGKIETYPEKINFTFTDSNIVVVNITPRIIKNDINRNIILQGKGFSKVISIGLSNNIILKDTSFNIITDEVMSVVIPKGLGIGKYKLNIMNVEGIYKTDIDIEIN